MLAKPGSVGRAAPGVELRLSDAGEICVRSPFLMDGYFDDAEATAAALHDGWYHTGDLGALDADGYLSIVGRMKDVIRTGGESVSPAEVEAALAGYGGVREVAVVGLPDPRVGRARLRGGRAGAGRVARRSRACARTARAASPASSGRGAWWSCRRCRARAATGQVQRALLDRAHHGRELKEAR